MPHDDGAVAVSAAGLPEESGVNSRTLRFAARCWYFTGRREELASLRRIVAWESPRLGLGEAETDRVVLAVDELATNARVYGPYELRMYRDPAGWGVADCRAGGSSLVATHLTGDHEVPSMDECGRGLLIVGTLFPDFEVVAARVPPKLPGKEIRLTVAGAGTGGGLR